MTWNADAEDSTWGEFVIRIRGGFRPGSDDWEAAMDRFIAVRRSVSLEHPEFADYLADTFALEL